MSKKLPAFSDIHTIAFDFDGVFTDNAVYVDQNGIESVRCSRADGLALDILRGLMPIGRMSAEMFVLSTEKNTVVAHRAKKLKIGCEQGIGNKLKFLEEYFIKKNLSGFDGLLFFGNDLNDLPVIRKPCFSVVPRDAHPLVKEAASLVVDQDGGMGFVRSFVETWLEANQLSVGETYELISNR